MTFPAPDAPIAFVLGRKGLPFYYKGEVKVPFEPRRGLVAATIDGRDPEADAAVQRLARELGLQRQDVGEPIIDNNIRVFTLPARASARARHEALRALLDSPSVRVAGPVVELSDDRISYLTSQLVVKFVTRVRSPEVAAMADRFGLRVVRHIRYAGNTCLLEAEPRNDYSLLDTAQALIETGDVVYAEPNMVSSVILYAIAPGDSLVPQQWHVGLIGLPEAWQTLRDENPAAVTPGTAGDLTYGSEDVTIAVFDSGIRSTTVGGTTMPNHPDLNGDVTSGLPKIMAFYDFDGMTPDNDAAWSAHGVSCSGVAAAMADNPSVVGGELEGVVGAAGNCRVIGAIAPFGLPNQRFADAFVWMAGFDPGWVADGINYPATTVFPGMLAQGADVFTNSIRVPDVGLLDDTFDFLTTYGRGGKGAVVLLAAGNTAATLAHPANNTVADHPKVLAVAASIDSDVRSGYSCFDPAIDVCAPSSGDAAQALAGAPGKVTTAWLGAGQLAGHTGGGLDYTNVFGGTSSATPLAAGVAALMLSIRPELTWIQARDILRSTAAEIDFANTDPVGQWIDTDGDGVPDFSQWYGYGRIDAAAAVIAARDYLTAADIVVRDNLADTGSVPSGGWHANSPDIWVRRSDDPIPALAYSAAPPHENPVRGQDNYLYLRVKNVGTQPSSDVSIRGLITHFPGFEFRYPDEWIPDSPPSSPVPSPLEPGTYLIGEVIESGIAPGEDRIVKMVWDQSSIPPSSVSIGGMTVMWHPCLLAEVSPHDGPAPAGATFDVKRDNNLAHKNISIDDPSATFGAATAVVAGTSDPTGTEAVIIDRSQLPAEARVFIRIDEPRIMAWWTDLVQEGRLAAADPLVTTGRPPAPAGVHEEGAGDESGACLVTLLDRSRLLVSCRDDRRIVIHALPGTHIQPLCGAREHAKPQVSLGSEQGRPVLVFEGGASALELPLRLAAGRYVPLVLGVNRMSGTGGGMLHATQRIGHGELSAGYSIAF